VAGLYGIPQIVIDGSGFGETQHALQFTDCGQAEFSLVVRQDAKGTDAI
jgi:hypothetical protein